MVSDALLVSTSPPIDAPLPALRHGRSAQPPDTHVLDWLARALDLADPDEMAEHDSPETVAVVPYLANCDVCRTHLARFDTVVTTRRQPDGVRAFACVACTAARGAQHLGPGGSTYLMQHDEVPRSVREALLRAGAADPWSETAAGPPWQDSYRALGFGGPNESDEMVRELGGWSIRATPDPRGAVHVAFTRTLPETTWKSTTEYVVPSDWSAAEVQHMLRHELEELHRPAWPAVLEVSIGDAEERVRHMLDTGAVYVSWTSDEIEKRPGQYLSLWSGSTSMYADVHRVARRSHDAGLLGRVVREHPDQSAVLEVLANVACPPDVVSQVAREPLSVRTSAVLRRTDLPEQDVVALAEIAVRGRARSVQDLVSTIAVHPHCPADMALVLADRLGPEHRGWTVARAAGLPMTRRHDLVDAFLDESRRSVATNDVVDAAVGLLVASRTARGLDGDEVARLLTHPNRRTKHLARTRLAELGAVPDLDDVPGALTETVLALRLRRWWGDVATGWLTSGGYADADAVGRAWLERDGDELSIGVAKGIDLGRFFADGLGAALEESLTVATQGSVTTLTWREVASRARRRQSSRPTDVFSPGDATDGRAEAAEHLRVRLAREPALSDEARAALAAVTVAGVSGARLWFAVPDEASSAHLWAAVGAASRLHEAISHHQEGQALYSVVVDPNLARESPVLLPGQA